MSRSDRRYFIAAGISGFAALTIAVIIGFSLQPKEPRFSGDRGYQSVNGTYRAGGRSCDPARLHRLSGIEAEKKTDRCQEAEEHHRIATDSLIEARRQADAADASAVAAYKQTGIAGWGAGFGFVTMLAAILAALFAERAAHHTKRSADESAANHRSFVERERGWLEIIEIEVINFQIYFSVRNIGPALAEITGVLADTETLYPNEPSSPIGDYRIKIRENNPEKIPIMLVIKDDDFTTVCGYIKYRTLSLNDCRTHFGVTVTRKGIGEFSHIIVHPMSAEFFPRDT